MAKFIELESCFNMSRDEAHRIADENGFQDCPVFVRNCECRDCGTGEDSSHWFHPPWVIKVEDDNATDRR